jgi:predicted nicotinamide N-methyase
MDTTRLQAIARAYTQSAVLFAAIDAELFSHISGGANTEEKLVKETGLRPLDIQRLVSCSLSMGLLQWADHGNSLVNAPDVQTYLVKGEKRYAGAWMTFTRADAPRWFDMTELMRSHRGSHLGKYEGMTVESARKYHQATASIGFGAARRFVKMVDLTGRKHLLDLGGGSGAYSITACEKHPDLKATVLDLEPVVAATQDYIADAGMQSRIDTIGADFTDSDYGGPYDVIVMASNLPIYDSPVIADVVARAWRALETGGQMHLIGEMLSDDRCGPVDAAMWGMSELITGGLGRAHTQGECRDYFEAAGFTDIALSEFVPGILVRCTGTRN